MTSEKREVRVVGGAGEISRAAAEELVGRAEEATGQRGVFTVALAGGSTPGSLYALLASEEEPFRDRMPWGKTEFFWGDERAVPPEHPDSNYRMAREAMLSRVPAPPENVHRIRAENPDPGAAAEEYERVLRSFFASRGLVANGLPRFDLVLLGMGADGHTASLFPGTGAVREQGRLVVALWVARFSSHRITMTPPLINNAACAMFLVAGEEKAETLRAVLESSFQPDTFPAQAIRPSEGELIWLVDRAAASRLQP